ncbi:MAG: glycoside hydrolase family 32 protein [Lachnospiraceae bacterium]|nr:glycoside hydrolase family 32 protein [Lachnospiraceae bacterium]
MISAPLTKARQYEDTYKSLIKDEERPVFHLSPQIGWMNDPNGFSYYNGAYHLFYQYHPYSTQWGPMHWGHVKSNDLLHWEYLPAALAPDEEYDAFGCFSGSATELSDGRQLLVYTGVKEIPGPGGLREVFQTQCLAVGDGLNYQKYEGNPVLTAADVPEGFSTADFRDPKIYRKEDGSYAMVAGNRTDDESGAILLFESEDGFHWHFASILDRSYNEYGRMWECPDFFELDGHQVLIVSPQDMSQMGLEYHNGNGTLALLGAYREDTKTFTRQHTQAIDYGIDFYAPQTLLSPDGRRIMIGWMQNWDTCVAAVAGNKWFGQMSLPRELSIRENRLIQNPVRELETLRGRRIAYENIPVSEEVILKNVYGRLVDLTIRLRPQSPDSYSLFRMKFARGSQHYSSLSYCPSSSTVRISRSHSGYNRDFVHERECFVRRQNGEIKIRLILDRYSAEVFINDGEQAMTMTFYTPLTADGISFEAHGTAFMDIEKYDLR